MKKSLAVSSMWCAISSIGLMAISYFCWHSSMDAKTAGIIGEISTYTPILTSVVMFQYLLWKAKETNIGFFKALGGGIICSIITTIIYAVILYVLIEVIDSTHANFISDKSNLEDSFTAEELSYFRQYYHVMMFVSTLTVAVPAQFVLSLLFAIVKRRRTPSTTFNDSILDA